MRSESINQKKVARKIVKRKRNLNENKKKNINESKFQPKNKFDLIMWKDIVSGTASSRRCAATATATSHRHPVHHTL